MNLQESGEMYLETIYILSKKLPNVHAIDVSNSMGYSKPSVSRAVGLLKKGGFITVDGDSHIQLTPYGLEVAAKILERHTLLTDFLCKLGVSKEVATEDACKMEHVISDETLDAIRNSMNGN
ncbi:MAG: metal-dependent transcriptional regulator [Clostridia bacterium]|jgi:Mn-dependent DtxR family transcriptional regulator|nr:metal-dependent transcriptional regulator [Clostridia bacterium]